MKMIENSVRHLFGECMIMEQLVNLISTINNWGDLSHKIETSHDGWISIKEGRINVIQEIEKLPGLKYSLHKEESPSMYSEKFYVMVTDEVGNLIELYLKSEPYAGLDLSEFIEKCISE